MTAEPTEDDVRRAIDRLVAAADERARAGAGPDAAWNAHKLAVFALVQTHCRQSGDDRLAREFQARIAHIGPIERPTSDEP